MNREGQGRHVLFRANAYTGPGETKEQFPELLNREYMAFVEQQLRDAGIVVPLMANDNLQEGYWAPGTGLGAADIYGIDAYPMRYDCAQPYIWYADSIPPTLFCSQY